MKKTIWILNHYASGMFFAKGGRHYSFAKYLKRAGYEPVIFGCNAKHNSQSESFLPLDSLWCERMEEEIGVPFVFVDGRAYQGNGKQRILNMVDFYRNVKRVAKEYAQLHGKPDVIYASSVHPLTLVAGLQLAKHYKVKCICEVRDLWPESLVAYGIAGASHPAVIAMRVLEKWIYAKTDSLIFTGDGAYDYIKEQGWEKAVPQDKVFYINNGVDLELFDANRENFPFDDEDLKNPDLFKVVYTGSIRKVNNLGLLLDAAKKIRNPKVKILVWGDGDELDMLQQRIMAEEIWNVIFKGKVDKWLIPSITSQADLNIAHNTPSPLFKYGISFNKLFDYLAAGKPVLSDFPCTYNPAIQWGAGRDVQDPTAENVAKAIEDMAALAPEEYETYCRRARKAAEQQYDFKALTRELIKILNA